MSNSTASAANCGRIFNSGGGVSGRMLLLSHSEIIRADTCQESFRMNVAIAGAGRRGATRSGWCGEETGCIFMRGR